MATRSLEKALEKFTSVASDVIPDADSTRDLGSSNTAFAVSFLDAIEPVGVDTTIKRVGGTATTPIVEGVAKAWANLNGTGTIALRDSFNISSVTDGGTGLYTYTFTNNFGGGNYSHTSGGERSSSGIGMSVTYSSGISSVQTYRTDGVAGAADWAHANITCIGDLA